MENTSVLERQVSKGTITIAGESTTRPQDRRTAGVAGTLAIGAEVIFVLGPPGSGKTTMVHALQAALEKQGRHVICCDDYPLLFAMAARELHSGESLAHAAQFCPLLDEHGALRGFTVKDLDVLEQVLSEINRHICQYLSQTGTVILVEFARDEYPYERVWQHFCHEICAQARYLFCDAAFAACVERVQRRPQHIDLEIMSTYYCKDGLPSLIKNCNLDRIEVITTNGTMQETKGQIACFLEKLADARLPQADEADLKGAFALSMAE